MASPPRPSLLSEIGPDGIALDNPVIAYTQKVIEQEQLQLKKYIQENYSKIRGVERELEDLSFELKLTAGPKKAAFEHLRKKIELQTEKIRAAKLKEEQARKVWEDAAKAVKDEEAIKTKLCDDLNQLVQESNNAQYSRLEELKRRLEAINPSRSSVDVSDVKSMEQIQGITTALQPGRQQPVDSGNRMPENASAQGKGNGESASGGHNQQPIEAREKRKTLNLGRGRGNTILHKGRGPAGPGWTGAGFDVDGGP